MQQVGFLPEAGVIGISMARRLVAALKPKSGKLSIERDDLIGSALIAFCEAYKSFDSSKGVGFKTHAYMRMRWAIKDFIRSETRRGELSDADNRVRDYCKNLTPTSENDPESSIIKYLEIQKIKQNISVLPQEDQSLLKKYYFNDSSFEAIAEDKCCNKSTVVRQHKKLIQYLRGTLHASWANEFRGKTKNGKSEQQSVLLHMSSAGFSRDEVFTENHSPSGIA